MTEINNSDLTLTSFVYVSAFPLLGKPVVVKTTHKEIINFIEMNKNEAPKLLKKMSNRIYRTLLDVNVPHLVKEMEAGNKQALQEWDDFCADVLIVNTIRFVLHNTPIPISDLNKDLPSIQCTM